MDGQKYLCYISGCCDFCLSIAVDERVHLGPDKSSDVDADEIRMLVKPLRLFPCCAKNEQPNSSGTLVSQRKFALACGTDFETLPNIPHNINL